LRLNAPLFIGARKKTDELTEDTGWPIIFSQVIKTIKLPCHKNTIKNEKVKKNNPIIVSHLPLQI